MGIHCPGAEGKQRVSITSLPGWLQGRFQYFERQAKSSGQGAASQTVRLYGKTPQRSHEGFAWRD
jgi:hypothetical protein